MRRTLLSVALGAAGLAAIVSGQAAAQQPAAKPNILVIFGDDIGRSDISAYTFGLMGFWTPNIDRIVKEGLMFTHYYAEQSCTAGRSTFIAGEATLRTGLSKVGVPGATVGSQKENITIAGCAEAARLGDRPVRQEPSRRPRRIPADQSRL